MTIYQPGLDPEYQRRRDQRERRRQETWALAGFTDAPSHGNFRGAARQNRYIEGHDRLGRAAFYEMLRQKRRRHR